MISQRLLTGQNLLTYPLYPTTMKIGVVTRGKYGERLLDIIKKRTDFVLESVEVPQLLPDFIEDPKDFVDQLNFDPHIFGSDVIITYTPPPRCDA